MALSEKGYTKANFDYKAVACFHKIRRKPPESPSRNKLVVSRGLLGFWIVLVLFYSIMLLHRPARVALSLSSLSSLLLATTAQGTTSSSSQADGLTDVAGTPTAASQTATIDGETASFRAIPTLQPSIDETPPLIPNIQDPEAVNAQTVCPGYTASNVVSNDYGFTASLSLAGDACNVYGTDVDALDLAVQYQSDDRLSVRISPSYISSENTSWYLLPELYLHQPALEEDANQTVPRSDLQFTWTNEPSFGFTVLRKSTGDKLFDTTGTKLVYENQFIEFVTAMPENYNLYGLGEHIHDFKLNNNFNATIYAADVGDSIDANIYGTHPFFLDTRYYEVDPQTGNMTLLTTNVTDRSRQYQSYSHGVFLRNAHGQEILLRPHNITWRTLGGSVDLYFYAGPSQKDITRSYLNSAIGLPAMQQYFTLGYHQCRWGYANWTQLQEVVDNFRKFDIPLENIWTDIDYMNQYRDFDNDQNTFPYDEGMQFLSKLNAGGQHYIPIVDSAIYIPNPNNASDAYGTYSRGHDQNAFLLNPDGSEYIGAVWPGYTVFPDWHSEGAHAWWTDEMIRYYRNVSFSGIWIDMSEASSFCVGSCGSANVSQNPVHPPFALPGEKGSVIYDYPEGFNLTNATEATTASSLSSSQSAANAATSAASSSTTSYFRTKPTPGVRSLDYPPYTLNNYNGGLPVHAVTPNATHHDGIVEYDVHNLFGHQILNATYNALLRVFPGKRPFIIGRSTFAGSGKYAGHWGGDNYSLWAFMYFSISQGLSFSLFGIPMFGVDTCGFAGNADEELCNRWMQLSAFFPFYRNHNTLTANPQEPYVWSSVIEATKKAMEIRYSLLPYMYTLFYKAHSVGATVMTAVQWEFPNEPWLQHVDNQFMLGPSLLITPVLSPQATTVNTVFPGAGQGTTWYDWYSQTAVEAQAGVNMTIEAPLGHIPVFVRGGCVLPIQKAGYTTTESRKNPWNLLVALDQEQSATGNLYIDDGESLAPEATRYMDLTVSKNALYASGRGSYRDMNPLANVTILGVQSAPVNVTLNGSPVAGVVYDGGKKVVSITGLNNMTTSGAWNADWVLSWSSTPASNSTLRRRHFRA